MTRTEELIQKLINGEDVTNWKCRSRLEEYLLACINKTGSECCPVPRSRVEALLYEYADCCKDGGSGGGTNEELVYLQMLTTKYGGA